MLTTTPIDPHQLIRFDDFLPDGPHSAWPRRTERPPLPVRKFLAVSALILGAYVVGGTFFAADAASPVFRRVAAPVAGDFRLGLGNAMPPGIVGRVAEPVPGDFRLGPGNAMPPGIVGDVAGPVPGDFRLAPGNAMPPGLTPAR